MRLFLDTKVESECIQHFSANQLAHQTASLYWHGARPNFPFNVVKGKNATIKSCTINKAKSISEPTDKMEQLID